MPLVNVFSEDPDLLRMLPAGAREDVGARSLVESIVLEPGPWAPDGERLSLEAPLGLLVLDGLVVHDLYLSGRRSVELIGQGDIVRPWVPEVNGPSLDLGTAWRVHEPTRLALLDASFARAIAEWPNVHAAIQDRLASCSRQLALQLAIAGLTGMDRKLLMTLRHLADRWGRVTPEGIVVRLPVTHDELAAMVGARRPSVSTAMSALARRGLLVRRHDGWLLAAGGPGPAGNGWAGTRSGGTLG